MTIERA